MESRKIIVKKRIEGKEVADVVFNANRFKSNVRLIMGDSHFNIKSLMGMFALHLEPDMEVLLEADGEDEYEAIQEMTGIFE